MGLASHIRGCGPPGERIGRVDLLVSTSVADVVGQRHFVYVSCSLSRDAGDSLICLVLQVRLTFLVSGILYMYLAHRLATLVIRIFDKNTPMAARWFFVSIECRYVCFALPFQKGWHTVRLLS